MDDNSVDAMNNLINALTAVAITLIVVGAAVWLIARIMKQRAARMDPKDLAMLEQMGRTAQRMEGRMAAVERILDAESPDWRRDASGPRSEGGGGTYEKQVG